MELWHRRLGHLHTNGVKKLINLSERITLLNEKEFICESCLIGKSTKLPFPSVNRARSSRPLELIHSDVCGPITPQTWNKKSYFVTFMDDFTHFTHVYLLAKKSEVA